MVRNPAIALILSAILYAWPGSLPVRAGEADVVGVRVEAGGNGTYTFHVTVRHDDAGWDHYADRWDVVTTEGTVLGKRVLLHPHDDEQPFTRSLSGVAVPEGVRTVVIRAHDLVHGLGGAEMTVDLPGR